jgi:hypothetical protein
MEKNTDNTQETAVALVRSIEGLIDALITENKLLLQENQELKNIIDNINTK